MLKPRFCAHLIRPQIIFYHAAKLIKLSAFTLPFIFLNRYQRILKQYHFKQNTESR